MDSTRRTEMFVDSEADRRADTATWGDERTMLVDSQRAHQATLELKCASLEGADSSRRSVEPSTLSLLGLVRHLGDVERRWFRSVMAGQRRAAAVLFRHRSRSRFQWRSV
jgi:hypothetical protein